MKEKPGTKTLEAKVAIREGKFSVVPLSETQKTPTVNYQQLIKNVINNMHKRLFTIISSHKSCVPSTLSYHAAYESLSKELKVLGPDHWPCDKPVG